jgi:hypothetical protein
MICIYLSQLIVSLKTQAQQSFLHVKHTGHQLSLDGAGLHGLDVDCVNSSSDHFAYLCISVSETMLDQKRMPIADRSHLRRQTVETNCTNEPWYLNRAAARRAWITVVL